MRRTLTIAALVTLPVGLLAACGDEDDGGGATAPASVPEGALLVEALDSLDFDRDQYRAEAGEVTFVYENKGSLPHTLLIEGIDEDEFFLEVGDTDTGSVELEPGTYTLYCDVPGHQAAGMEATLVVE